MEFLNRFLCSSSIFLLLISGTLLLFELNLYKILQRNLFKNSIDEKKDRRRKIFPSPTWKEERSFFSYKEDLSFFNRFLCSSSIFLLISGVMFAVVDSIGINYGQIANNLPSPQDVIPLLKSIGATKVKLYDADSRVLRAFANTGIEFVVGLGNEYLSKMKDSEKAEEWVKSNVQTYLPATKITCITVGNEVLTFNDTSLTSNLLPAMQSVHTALVKLGLDKQVSVTTAHSLAVLETSYPPSAGAFRRDLKDYISQILNFQSKTGSSLLINAYPFFAYKGDPKQVSLDYVLFQSKQGIVDPISKLSYDNMLFAQIDAVYAALATMGYKKLSVQISETGWPSKGDEDEVGATPENAMKYNGNLMKLVSQNKKTPMRPSTDLDVYIFALFNENLKPGPASERNYGLFKPDGTPVYKLANTGTNGGNNTTRGGGDDDGSFEGPSSPISSSTGYLNISSAKAKFDFGGSMLHIQGTLWACLTSLLLFF